MEGENKCSWRGRVVQKGEIGAKVTGSYSQLNYTKKKRKWNNLCIKDERKKEIRELRNHLRRYDKKTHSYVLNFECNCAGCCDIVMHVLYVRTCSASCLASAIPKLSAI